MASCPIGADGAARQRQAVIHQQGVLSYLLKLLTLLADTLASPEFSMSSPLSPPPHIASLKSTFFNCEKTISSSLKICRVMSTPEAPPAAAPAAAPAPDGADPAPEGAPAPGGEVPVVLVEEVEEELPPACVDLQDYKLKVARGW